MSDAVDDNVEPDFTAAAKAIIDRFGAELLNPAELSERLAIAFESGMQYAEKTSARHEQALSFLSQAKSALDHVGGRTKTEQAAAKTVRQMIETAESALSGATAPPLAAPVGAREGISIEPRAEWRRR